MTTMTHSCGLAGIMWDAGLRMTQTLVRGAYWYEENGMCIGKRLGE
jgi:hypothetical protein